MFLLQVLELAGFSVFVGRFWTWPRITRRQGFFQATSELDVRIDEELGKIFGIVIIVTYGVLPNIENILLTKKGGVYTKGVSTEEN